ncbi:unnamed protein product, partial [Closterium sp. NIES-54]
MAGPEERGGRVAGGSGEAQAQGQPCDSAMAPMQPSLGPPRDEPRVFGLDKFNGDNFAEWSFKMENIFDHFNLLEVIEGTEKRPENDPEKSPWVRKSAQGYLLLGQALGSSQIRHIKPFQREPEKGPKAWAALKCVHAPATAAVAVVLERQMAALRIEEDEAVEEGVQKFFDLLTRLEGADLNYSELQKKTKLLALLPESWSSLIINLNSDSPHLSLEDVKGQGGSRFGSNNFNGGRGSGGYGSDNKSYGRGRGRFDDECHYCQKSGHMWRDCFKLPDGWTPAQGQEGRGAGGGRGRGRGVRGGRGGGAASMKSTGNESKSRDDRFPGQFFFVSTQAPAGPEKDEGFEEPAAVGKVTLHSLDYWVIDSGATYSMTPRADLLTELEPSPVKHVTSALGQRAEVKGMGKAMFKGADGKMVGLKNFTRYPFSSSEATAKAPLDEVVMDVVGPLKLGAARAEYLLTIVDVYTRMTWVYVLSKKSDMAETVKTDWLPMVERQQDRLVKAIRTDRGGEFLSKEFSLWLKKNGIRHSLTMPYSPAMNGIAEQANRTITETARGLLVEVGLPDYFWPDAVRSACMAKTRALTHVGVDKWVPYVEWIGRKPKVDMLRVFGCMCMALVPKHLRHNKLGAKAIWAVHLGMAQNSKGWLLWDPFTKKFLGSRDCKFMENLMYKDWKAENEAKIDMRFGEVKSSGLEHVELPLELRSNSTTTTRQSSLVNGGEEAKDAEEEEEEVQQLSERAPTLPSRTTSAPRIRVTPQQRQGLHVPAAEEEGRGKRRIQAPNRLTYDALGKPAKSALAGAALIVGDDEESDYEECKAMESELKSIEENGTWELVELPEGRKASTSKWLLKIKSDADGKIERYKYRLVAKGYQQKEKVDYKELFAPVVKPTTLRTLLAGAAIKGWVVKQMDVTTAFLNGVLEEEIFMAQPEGFDDGSGRVLRLKKALYGLKQNLRQWYLKLRGVLEEIGFTPSSADHSLFMLGEGEQRSFMVVYVDDILIFSPSFDLVKEVMLKLQDKFKCKALGDVNFYLGLQIERDVEKRCMRVHQRKYLEALAANFGQSEGHVATPESRSPVSTQSRRPSGPVTYLAALALPFLDPTCRPASSSPTSRPSRRPLPAPLRRPAASRRPAAPLPLTCSPAAITCGPAALPYGPAALNCGPATLICGPRRPYLRTPPPLPAASPPLPATPSPSAVAPPPLPAAPSPVPAAVPPLPAAPPPPFPAAQPPSPAASPHLPAVLAALNCGLAAPYLRPRRPYLRPRRPSPAAPPPLTCGPVAPTCGPAAPHLRSLPPTPAAPPPSLAALPPFPSAPSLAAAPRTTRAARAAEPPEQPSRPTALQPSRPAATPPGSRAAQQPSRPAFEQPSRPAAEPPCSRAAEPPYLRASTVVMAKPNVLAFDAEGRAIDFDVWVDDLQLFLQCDTADGLSLFDLTSDASPAPAVDADATVRSQWATRDAAARLAIRRHLPTSERAHFSQYKSAQTLYDAVVACYSSPATAALSRLLLLYLFPDLAAFSTVADLITHLHTSDTRYRAALPADFCAKNPPPMYITLYYIVTRLPDSLRVVRDHFLSVCPTTLTVDLLEKSLLAAEQSIVAVGASRGDPRTPIFEGCSPSSLLPSVASVATADLFGLELVEVEAAGGVGVAVGVEVGVEVSVAAVGAEAMAAVAVGAGVAEAAVEEAAEAAVAVGVAVELVAGLRRGVAPVVVRASSSSAVCGGAHPTQRCFGRLTDTWRRQFPEATEIPRWGELSRAGVAIYDLDLDAVLSAMYDVSISDEGDCYRCFPPDPGIETAALGTGEAAALGACDVAALGASASASSGTGESALSGAASASASLTFTLDSGASRSFFRDRTTLTPLSRPVAVSLADPSRGPVMSHFSTVLSCPVAPSGTLSGLYLPSFSTNLVSGADLQDGGVHQFTPACQRVTHCTEASTGRHLATFTRQPGSSLYTLTTPSPPVAESVRVAASGQVFAAASRSGPESAPCSCRLLSHETLLWHHRLGHPSLLRLRGMASRFLVSGLPRSLPPLPQGPGPTCVPCVEGRQRAAPHSSQFPPTEAPLQTLHMDVWSPARVSGQGHERYFLLVVDDYSRYTSVFPLRSKGDVTAVLIDWIRAVRLQLRQSFGSDFPVLRLHSDRGGEFSSGLLGAYCRAQGIRQTFTLPDSPQQNGIAERRIGMVMDVARTSMMHAAAPHFLWPFAVRYAAHQINLHPRVSRPETSPALLWTGKVGDASAFRVWGSRAFVRDLSADKVSPRAAPCVFLGFPPDAPGWQFYHPTSRRVLSSQDVTFDESVPYYRLFPYRTPSLPPPPLFLVPGPPPVDPLPPQGPTPSGVSQVDAVEPVEVSGDSGAARGAEPWGADSEGAEPGGAATGGAAPGGAEPGGTVLGGAEPGGAATGGAEPGGAATG